MGTLAAGQMIQAVTCACGWGGDVKQPVSMLSLGGTFSSEFLLSPAGSSIILPVFLDLTHEEASLTTKPVVGQPT